MKRWLVVGVVAAVLAGVAVWYLFLRNDAPEALSIEGAVSQVATTSPPPSAGATTTPVTEVAVASLDGVWVADPENTIVGYRIGEELSSIGVAEAVGRTSDVAARLELAGSTVDTVEVIVDMATLRSDSGRRDSALETRGLETAAFPEASFRLTDPVDLGDLRDGEAVSVTASGELTLHGVTRPVTVPLDVQLVGDRAVVVGSVEVTLADYDIEKPTGFAVLSIEDVGLLEFQVTFVREG